MSEFANPAGGAAAAASSYTQRLLALLGDQDPWRIWNELLPALEQSIAGLSPEQLRRAEKPGKWSIQQVIQHLADSEWVYGYRFRQVVAQSGAPLAGYDQDGWARELRYEESDPREALETIRFLRGRTTKVLQSLNQEQWARYGMHSERGRESVEHIFKLLAAHDLVHRRQIERIRAGL